ncbi:MAG: MurR/RpiR family transcriptional regulator, partial [Thermodesulfobacteriota bacterium]
MKDEKVNKQSKNKGLLSRLRALDRLTRTERKIAVFFEQNPKLLAFESLTRLSAKAGVSKASMNRFLMQRLGYESFLHFKTECRKQIEHQLESPIQRYQRRHSGKADTYQDS